MTKFSAACAVAMSFVFASRMAVAIDAAVTAASYKTKAVVMPTMTALSTSDVVEPLLKKSMTVAMASLIA